MEDANYKPPQPSEALQPLDEYLAVSTAAAQTGMEVWMRPVIEIDYEKLTSRYYKKVPDFTLIRRLINDGHEIPGATLTTRVEYVLSHERSEDVSHRR